MRFRKKGSPPLNHGLTLWEFPFKKKKNRIPKEHTCRMIFIRKFRESSMAFFEIYKILEPTIRQFITFFHSEKRHWKAFKMVRLMVELH